MEVHTTELPVLREAVVLHEPAVEIQERNNVIVASVEGLIGKFVPPSHVVSIV